MSPAARSHGPARVRPRVRRVDGGSSGPVAASEPILLEDAIEELLAARAGGRVFVRGVKGSGKSTALEVLRERFRTLIATFESPGLSVEMRVAQAEGRLVIAALETGSEPFSRRADAVFELVPWDDDDVVEYLLARAPDRCAELAPRLLADPVRAELGGLPLLWTTVIESMLCTDGPRDLNRALRRVVRHPDRAHGHRELQRYVSELLRSRGDQASIELRRVTGAGAPRESLRLVRHRPVQIRLGADRVAALLRLGTAPPELFAPLPRDLLGLVARRIRSSRRALAVLFELVDGPSASGRLEYRGRAATLLTLAAPDWLKRRAERHGAIDFHLIEGDLSGLDLTCARFDGLRLSGCLLGRVDLSELQAEFLDLEYARLPGADLNGALVERLRACHADMKAADLRFLAVSLADLRGASLRGAGLQRAQLPGADFRGADLTAVDATRASLRDASFRAATLTDACLVDAALRGACLAELDLRTTDLRGADLAEADLSGALLSEVEIHGARLPGANLAGASLTSARLQRADLLRADLRGAGLALVDLREADLRGALLAGAGFQLGSTRSGVIPGGYPSQGTRTGFYADDLTETAYRRIPEIRKADLRGADLRGATLEGTDFYLVDLRGARFTAEQEAHLRRTGAILGEDPERRAG